MSYAITLLALLIILAGLSLLAQPRLLMDFMARYRDSHALYAGAVLVRLVFGILLLTFADQSRWPMFLQVIGWIALAAAAVLLAMGRARFGNIIDEASGMGDTSLRIGGLFAAGFGALLGAAVI